MVKTLTVTLSKEVGDLKAGIVLRADAPPVACRVLAESQALVEALGRTLRSASALVPCDALRTLAETRRIFAAFLLEGMRLAGGGGAVTAAAVARRARAL